MNGDDDRRRRTVAAQAFAALALCIFAQGARAATQPAHAQRISPSHRPMVRQSLAM